jgi:NitT/TauT family transport system ATP-binding protein
MLFVEHLRKEYPQLSGASTLAIRDISFTVERRRFASIVGPSGCGKTTLLMCLAGLARASSGRVVVDGVEVTGPPPTVTLVFQDYAKSLLPWRTVIGNVRLGLEARRRPAIDARAQHYLELVGLGAFARHYPWELSGGMQQRVAIARALAYGPAVLMMDEPFGSVDALTRLDLEDLLLGVWKELGTTILFVTHDLDEAVYLSDDIHVLSGRPSEIVLSIESKLPRPRDQLATREHPEFLEHRHAIYATIRTQVPRTRGRE